MIVILYFGREPGASPRRFTIMVHVGQRHSGQHDAIISKRQSCKDSAEP
jgi:hypothetical protein